MSSDKLNDQGWININSFKTPAIASPIVWAITNVSVALLFKLFLGRIQVEFDLHAILCIVIALSLSVVVARFAVREMERNSTKVLVPKEMRVVIFIANLVLVFSSSNGLQTVVTGTVFPELGKNQEASFLEYLYINEPWIKPAKLVSRINALEEKTKDLIRYEENLVSELAECIYQLDTCNGGNEIDDSVYLELESLKNEVGELENVISDFKSDSILDNESSFSAQNEILGLRNELSYLRRNLSFNYKRADSLMNYIKLESQVHERQNDKLYRTIDSLYKDLQYYKSRPSVFHGLVLKSVPDGVFNKVIEKVEVHINDSISVETNRDGYFRFYEKTGIQQLVVNCKLKLSISSKKTSTYELGEIVFIKDSLNILKY